MGIVYCDRFLIECHGQFVWQAVTEINSFGLKVTIGYLDSFALFIYRAGQGNNLVEHLFRVRNDYEVDQDFEVDLFRKLNRTTG